MSLYDEPKQQPQSQHILVDDRSRAWVEVPEPNNESYQARVSLSITWVVVSALAYKLARLLLQYVSIVPFFLCLGLLALPVAFVLYQRWRDDESRFSTLVYFTLAVLGVVIGGY